MVHQAAPRCHERPDRPSRLGGCILYKRETGAQGRVAPGVFEQASDAGPTVFGTPDVGAGRVGDGDAGRRRPWRSPSTALSAPLPGSDSGGLSLKSVSKCSILLPFVSGPWDIWDGYGALLEHEWTLKEPVWARLERGFGRCRLRLRGGADASRGLFMETMIARAFALVEDGSTFTCAAGKFSHLPHRRDE